LSKPLKASTSRYPRQPDTGVDQDQSEMEKEADAPAKAEKEAET